MDENTYYSFEDYLKDYTRNFKPYRYLADIMYRSVCFNKHGQTYLIYCRDHKLVNNFEDIRYEVRAYEKRKADAEYAGTI